MNEKLDQSVERAIALIETLNIPEGTAADHLLGCEFRLSDLSSRIHALKSQVSKTELESVQKFL